MKQVEKRHSIHSTKMDVFILRLFLFCFITLVDSKIFSAPLTEWQCRVIFNSRSEHAYEVEVDCEGEMKISRSRNFTGIPQSPWEVFAGFQVFGVTQSDERSLILLTELSLTFVNSSFSKNPITLPSTLSSPITVINSTLAIQDSTFFVSDSAQESGGIFVKGNSSLFVENCVFLGNLTSSVASRAGAIYATENSFLTITRSLFQSILSKEAAISVDRVSTIRFYNNNFIQNNGGEGSAVLVKNAGVVSVAECLFSLCTSSLYAAVTAIDTSIVEIKLSNFSDNFGKTGGALHASYINNSKVSVEVHESYFVRNTAADRGGGIYLSSSAAAIACNHFDSNTANKNGGGLYIQKTKNLVVDSCSFVSNLVTLTTNAPYDGCGAGVFAERVVEMVFTNTTFIHNTAIRSGGGGYFKEVESIEVLDSYVGSNRGRDHAGVSVHDVSVWIMNKSVVENNKAEAHTGGLYFRHSPTVLFDDVEFFNNSADLAGAVFVGNSSISQMKSCKFKKNFALRGSGGALKINKVRKLDICGTEFSSNVAEDQGGAFYAQTITKELVFDSSIFEMNTARKGGASLIRSAKAIKVKSSMFLSNFASMGSGGAMLVQNSKNLVIKKIFYMGNQAKENGGALCFLSLQRMSTTKLTLKKIKFKGNRVEDGSGGGLYCEGASDVKILEAWFQCNNALAQGGAVAVVHGSDVLITSSLFENNCLLTNQHHSFSNCAGSFCAPLPNLLLAVSTATEWNEKFSNVDSSTKGSNPARYGDPFPFHSSGILADVIQTEAQDVAREGRNGGALMTSSTTKVTLESIVFRENQVPGKGGALFSEKHAQVSIQDVHFVENKAGIGGGAISVHQTDLALHDLEFRNNHGNRGGTMEITAGNMIAERIQTTRNHAMSDAGVIFCEETAYVHFNVSKFTNDDSKNGTAFLAGCGCQLTVLYSEMECTDPEAKGCGVARSAEHCAASAMFLYPGKPETYKTQQTVPETAVYRTEAIQGRKALPDMRKQEDGITKVRNRWKTLLLVFFSIVLFVIILSVLRFCLSGGFEMVLMKKRNHRENSLPASFNEQSNLSATLLSVEKEENAPPVISLKDGSN